MNTIGVAILCAVANEHLEDRLVYLEQPPRVTRVSE